MLFWEVRVRVRELPATAEVCEVMVGVHTVDNADNIDAMDLAEYMVQKKWPRYFVEAVAVNGVPIV
ncbi:MAG: hypothetical protein E6Q97_19495 [Desulfurellales bacterium]|nr:MAG: hypothetical protein E6Q97_19495 [Desulfurellales bacterium]